MLGGERNYKWHHTVLINWKDHRFIYVTEGLDGPWDQGDFWVGDPGTPPTDTTPPSLVGASTTQGVDDEVLVTFSEAVASGAASAGHYTITPTVSVTAAAMEPTPA